MTRHKAAPAVPPPAPPHLSPKAQALWGEVVLRLDSYGKAVVSSAGRMALLTAALEALDRADQARVQLDAEGLLLPATASGLAHVHPLTRVEKDARAQFMSAWSALGLGR